MQHGGAALSFMNLADLAKRFRIDKQDRFRLSEFKTDETCGLGKEQGEAMLKDALKRIHDLQEIFYADGRFAILIVLQAMDAAGKDGIIGHVIGAMNPQGCEVQPFKAPNEEELAHDFLWRVVRHLPARGRIGVFNRSYYEEVLVVRVHPELLEKSKLSPGKGVWAQRYDSIRGFEQHLVRNGTPVLKFFLNISREEQRKRFLARLDEPDKNWKFSMGDVRERALWPKYMEAYEDAIRATASADAPWFVVPSDRKWFSRLVVAAALIDSLESLQLSYPKLSNAAVAELKQARESLEAEKPGD
jgi:PPK2 family polyphosphate:nucleotide phosphotransferase